MLGFSYFGSQKEELTIDAADENLDDVLAFIDERTEKMGFGPRTRRQIEVAVEELFVNISHYAYSPDKGKATIRFEQQYDPPRAVITLIDSGMAYDPLAKPDPDLTLPLEERPIGGLGIYMTKNFVDGIRYERKDEKNILTIEKIVKEG
ncbi:MAG: ATP-binding protein [Lachnospiraceae bacterium]|nr:ATP-binding protein [Lachnospiraceae bacterium]